VAKVGEVEF
jgi:hypothetical protein